MIGTATLINWLYLAEVLGNTLSKTKTVKKIIIFHGGAKPNLMTKIYNRNSWTEFTDCNEGCMGMISQFAILLQ